MHVLFAVSNIDACMARAGRHGSTATMVLGNTQVVFKGVLCSDMNCSYAWTNSSTPTLWVWTNNVGCCGCLHLVLHAIQLHHYGWACCCCCCSLNKWCSVTLSSKDWLGVLPLWYLIIIHLTGYWLLQGRQYMTISKHHISWARSDC